MSWKNGLLTDLKILSKVGNKCTLHYKGKVVTFDTKKGNIYKLNSNLNIENGL